MAKRRQKPQPEPSTDPPRPVDAGWAHVRKLRNRLRDELLFEFSGEVLEGDRLDYFVHMLRKLLPGSPREENVRESVIDVIGELATRKLLTTVCWRLAANYKRLRARPVPPWYRQVHNEWVTSQVSGVRRSKLGWVPGYMISFQLLNGLGASMTIEKFWSTKFCQLVGRKELGFTKIHGSRPLRDPREFVSLRLQLLLDKNLSGVAPVFEQTRTNPSLDEWNRKLTNRRQPAKRECPEDFTHNCYLCPVGLADCELAVHANTYHHRLCPVCNDEEAPFDHGLSENLCVNCLERQALQGE